MNLTPREKDKLMIAVAAQVARARLARGVKLNYPESVAVITDFVLEGARDGRSVAELMSESGKVLTREGWRWCRYWLIFYYAMCWRESEMATEYRRRMRGYTWHFCSNCSQWPTDHYVTSRDKPRTHRICVECVSKKKAGKCEMR